MSKDLKQLFQAEEISIKDLLHIFLDRKWIFVYSAAFFLVIGILRVATTPKYYEATSTYISEVGSGDNQTISGGFADLLGLSGSQISSSSTGSFRDPGFYPAIVSSQPFLLDIMNEEFYFSIYDETLTLKEFVERHDSRNILSRLFQPVLSIPSRIIALFEKSPPSLPQSEIDAVVQGDSINIVNPIVRLDPSQLGAMENLKDRLEISASGNIIKVIVTMPDPLVCAQVNQRVSEKLLDFIIKNETEKERRDLEFIERRVTSAKENFERSQNELARFRDENRQVVFAQAATEEEKLQAEYSIDFGIYQRLATELEEKKIALEEKTPVFTVFEPVYIPVFPANSVSASTLIIYIFLGVVVGGVWIIGIVLKAIFF